MGPHVALMGLGGLVGLALGLRARKQGPTGLPGRFHGGAPSAPPPRPSNKAPIHRGAPPPLQYATGPGSQGAPCFSNDDCGSGACFNGVCQPVQIIDAPAGTPCTSYLQCASGSCVNGICAAPAPPPSPAQFLQTFLPLPTGAPCTTYTQCASHQCTNGACAPPPAVTGLPRSPCTTNNQCESLSCVNGVCT